MCNGRLRSTHVITYVCIFLLATERNFIHGSPELQMCKNEETGSQHDPAWGHELLAIVAVMMVILYSALCCPPSLSFASEQQPAFDYQAFSQVQQGPFGWLVLL